MHRTTAILLLILLVAVSRVNGAEIGHEHQSLTPDPALTLSELVTRTLAHAPSLTELESQAGFAAAWNARAASWLGGAPALSLRYQTDRFNSNAGVEEYEAGLELPLWRWREKSASKAFASSLEQESQDALAQLRWEVAGMVRHMLWQVAEAETDHMMAERAAAIAASVMIKVERAHELGDTALGEVLIARSNRLQAVNNVIEKEAALLDAERTYAVLTQGSVRPVFSTERLSHLTALPADHVSVIWLNSQVARASAGRDRIEKASRGRPSLLIGPRWEQAPNDPESYNSLGLTLRFPFATNAYAAPEIAGADVALASATAERDRRLRQLQLMFHEASHELHVVTEQLAAAAESAELARQQIDMGSTAYEAGELNLLNLLLIQSSALAAERQAALLEVARNRAIARYNQAVGDIP
jgi:outer membrane protein TolC